MRLSASFSSAVRPVLTGRPRAARVLGAGHRAIYLQVRPIGREPGRLLVLASDDAVRLPCALVLPTTSDRLPLSALMPAEPAGGEVRVRVGAGRLRWHADGEQIEVSGVREWPAGRVIRCVPRADRVAELEAGLRDRDLGVSADLTAGLPDDRGGAVLSLLGRGPGLTPAGDDVLCGYLLASAAFGVDAGAVRSAVRGLSTSRTTALSAALLHHALDGECAPQVARAVTALSRPACLTAALSDLLAIGHTSGPALAHGIALAAAARVPAVAA